MSENVSADAKVSYTEIDVSQLGGEAYKKGAHYLGIREYVLASKAFKQAMLEDPGQPVYQAYYGWSLFTLSPEENTDEAMGHIRAALIKQPKWAKGHFFLGRIFALNGKNESAIKAFKAAIKARPRYQDARTELQKCEARVSKPPDRPSFTDRLVGWTKKK